MSIEQITDHADQAKDRLPRHLDAATNFLALLDIVGARTQELETQNFKLLDERHLSVAVGVQLDGLGQILNLPREVGQNDADYRAELVAATGVLAQSGQIEVLIDTFLRLSLALFLTVDEIYPARMQMVAHYDADTVDPAIDQAILDAMDRIKAGGVGLDLLYAEETTFFSFADVSEVDASDNGPSSADNGFGDEALSEGGGLARLII